VAGRSASYVIGALGIAAATTLFLLGGESATPAATPPELVQIAADLDTRIREAAAGLRSRAQTLADLPRLAAAASPTRRRCRTSPTTSSPSV
jgi:hypothetical protein